MDLALISPDQAHWELKQRGLSPPQDFFSQHAKIRISLWVTASENRLALYGCDSEGKIKGLMDTLYFIWV